jgi:hypothetical protein
MQSTEGDSAGSALEASLRSSDAIVSILPRQNQRRPNLFFEFGVAIALRKRFIAIVPQELDKTAIPFDIRGRKYLTKGAPEEAAREVAETLSGRAA